MYCYRLCLVLALLSLGECHWNRGYRYTNRARRWHYTTHDRRFDRLATHVIAADRYLRGFCRANTNCNVRELYVEEGYKLVYSLPQCSVDFISVRIKHRVLYMSAQQATSYRPETFVDMRILPDMLKLDEATWSYGNGLLEIVIPYKMVFKTELEKTCGEISTRVIRVPQMGYQFGFRMGGDEEETVTEEVTEVYNTNNGNATTDSYDLPDLTFNENEFTDTPKPKEESDRLIFSS